MINISEIVRRTMGWCPVVNMGNPASQNGIGYTGVSALRGSGQSAGSGVIYEEKAPYSNTIKLIVILGFFVLALSYLFAVFAHFFGFENAPEQAQFALLLAVSLYALIMWGFFSMKFRITDSGVEAVMPPFKYGIPFSDIKSVRTIENTPWYAGWGMHLWGRRLFFVSMRKSVVAIEKRNGFFRTIILTTRNPEVFIQKIKEKIR
jgi:hypothetical protein